MRLTSLATEKISFVVEKNALRAFFSTTEQVFCLAKNALRAFFAKQNTSGECRRRDTASCKLKLFAPLIRVLYR
jgi:hypothetical protein